MRILKLRPVEITPRILASLEKRNLLRTFKPTAKLLEGKSIGPSVKDTSFPNVVDTVYASSDKFGSHRLICVGLNHTTKIRLNSHPDNEEFIVINNTGSRFKPLYLIVGLHKHSLLEKKARGKKLDENDFIALRLKYNDHRTSIFTLLKDTPHCEITSPGKGASPIFFVTESAGLTMSLLNLYGYDFVLHRSGKKRF